MPSICCIILQMGPRGGRRSVVLALVFACLVAGIPSAPAAPAHKFSDATGPLDTAADLDAALRFEALIPEHTFGGMVTAPPLRQVAAPRPDREGHPHGRRGRLGQLHRRLPGGAVVALRAGEEGADASSASTPSATIGEVSKAVRFWRAQRDEARTRGREMVEYYHVLVNIAKSWQTTFDPHIDDSRNYDDIGYIDFGGGIVPGEAGLLMRTCTPAAVDPAKPWGDVRVNGHGPAIRSARSSGKARTGTASARRAATPTPGRSSVSPSRSTSSPTTQTPTSGRHSPTTSWR